jgi:hypothetical protein
MYRTSSPASPCEKTTSPRCYVTTLRAVPVESRYPSTLNPRRVFRADRSCLWCHSGTRLWHSCGVHYLTVCGGRGVTVDLSQRRESLGESTSSVSVLPPPRGAIWRNRHRHPRAWTNYARRAAERPADAHLWPGSGKTLLALTFVNGATRFRRTRRAHDVRGKHR